VSQASLGQDGTASSPAEPAGTSALASAPADYEAFIRGYT
jgi:hypothetical protein